MRANGGLEHGNNSMLGGRRMDARRALAARRQEADSRPVVGKLTVNCVNSWQSCHNRSTVSTVCQPAQHCVHVPLSTHSFSPLAASNHTMATTQVRSHLPRLPGEYWGGLLTGMPPNSITCGPLATFYCFSAHFGFSSRS